MVTETRPQPIVALVKDLMFGSKISATARAVGREVVLLRDPVRLSDQAGSLLLVDLSIAGATEAAVAWQTANRAQVVGFASHIDNEAMQRAREVGITRVLPKSAFSSSLESLMQNG